MKVAWAGGIPAGAAPVDGGLPVVIADGRRRASALAPATCGELVQGLLDGRDFLITSPIDFFSVVTVELRDEPGVSVLPDPELTKVKAAAHLTLARLGLSCGATVQVCSSVPQGKGLASSSSDITATIHATAEAAGVALPPYVVSSIAVSIEPTDAVFYDGSVVYDHIRGELIELLGPPPPLGFVIMDGGGTVETVTFDRERSRANARVRALDLARAVSLIRQGYHRGLPHLIAEGATISAVCNQKVLPKPELDVLLAGAHEAGALGVNCAHSGTVLGVMFDPRRTNVETLIRRVEHLVGAEKLLGTFHLVGGGARLLEVNSSNLSAPQRTALRDFRGHVTRVQVPGGFVIELNPTANRDHRRFIHADGRVDTEHPDPAECQLQTRGTPERPGPGELWEMRVKLVSSVGGLNHYRVMASEAIGSLPRSLPKVDFESAFLCEGETWARYVRIAAVGNGGVLHTVEGEEGPPRSLPIPIFISSFRKSMAPVAAAAAAGGG